MLEKKIREGEQSRFQSYEKGVATVCGNKEAIGRQHQRNNGSSCGILDVGDEALYDIIGRHMIGRELCANGGLSEFKRKCENQPGFRYDARRKATYAIGGIRGE